MTSRTYKISKYTPSLLQGRLELSAVAKHETRALSMRYPLEDKIFRALVIALGVLVVCYLYFVAASVMNVIARKESSTQAAILQGNIGALEREYFALHEKIAPEHASTIGLAPIEETDYVYVPQSTLVSNTARDNI